VAVLVLLARAARARVVPPDALPGDDGLGGRRRVTLGGLVAVAAAAELDGIVRRVGGRLGAGAALVEAGAGRGGLARGAALLDDRPGLEHERHDLLVDLLDHVLEQPERPHLALDEAVPPAAGAAAGARLDP